MKYPFTWAALCLLLVGCGEPKRSSPPPVKKVYHSSLARTPLFLYKEVQTCFDKEAWPSYDLGLVLFLDGGKKYDFRNFDGLIEKNLVKNDEIIFNTTYGEAVELIYRGSKIDFVQEAYAKDVDLCPDTLTYSTNSVESAALNASYFINKTHKVFTEATGLKVNSVAVKIGPKVAHTFVTAEEKATFFLTDNAYYQPAFETITFLPHSLEARMNGFQINFWEIPMVASHEYGHHLFHTIFPYTDTEESAPGLCFDNRTTAFVSDEESQLRTVTINDVLHSFNEGFADLVAYYTLGESERGLDGVKCLEKSRDVSSDVFFDGTRKVFSHSALWTYFFSRTQLKGKTCEQVDYQDEHAIGAIFAHNADRFLTRLTDSPELKLKVLHDWISLVRTNHTQLSRLSPERYFEEVFQIFLRLSLKKFDRNFDRSSCDEVKTFYPGLLARIVECSK